MKVIIVNFSTSHFLITTFVSILGLFVLGKCTVSLITSQQRGRGVQAELGCDHLEVPTVTMTTVVCVDIYAGKVCMIETLKLLYY